ncbi:hypothetical protein M758_10G144400 [Ceratodon purpureus]|uniref:Uncharacterized protein n=1 Tax=Ceratodon purpureus TaxID=3225 RepID=A0A8T0GPA6_CERPU|nr:hypothetical protein KC19_10G150100 [Ceratodon purpureus]KAG0604095.1 hypothetical protein M758_10G144400 [Ceratodon purpureus]
MAEAEEFRCFVGGLSWNTTDKGLEDEFRHFGNVLEAKVIVDKETGHSRGFGFVNFGDERSMDEAIERLHGKELDGRPITVNRAKPKGRDGGGDRGYGGGGGGRGGGGGGGGGDCFKCGQPGHWARECPTGGGDRGGGGRYSGRDRYDSGSDRYGGGDRYGSGGGGGRYGGGRGSDRYGDRSGGPDRKNGGPYARESRTDYSRERESSRGSDRYAGGDRYASAGGGASRYEGSTRDRSGPYDRPSGGSRGHDDRY